MVNLNKNNNGPKENVDNTNVSKQTEVKWNRCNQFCGVLTSVTLALVACLINDICYNIFETSHIGIFILPVTLFFLIFEFCGMRLITTGVRLLFPPKSNEIRDFSAAAFHIIAGIMLIMCPAMLTGCFNAFSF